MEATALKTAAGTTEKPANTESQSTMSPVEEKTQHIIKVQKFPAPPTASKELKEFLKVATPVGGPINGPEDLKAAREGFKLGTIDFSEECKETYTQSTNEIDIDGVRVLEVTPKNAPQNGKIILEFHGGGFALGAPDHLYQNFAPVGYHAGVEKIYAVDYALAPDKPFPQAPNDCLTVFKNLNKKYGSENIVLLGHSAGATLSLALILLIHEENKSLSKEEHIKLPAGMVLYSPLVDVDKNSDSFYTLGDSGASPVIRYMLGVDPILKLYIGENDRQHPLISVINGDFTPGCPPMLLVTGTRDGLQSECARLQKKLRMLTSVELTLEEGRGHEHLQLKCPESEDSAKHSGSYIKRLFQQSKL